MNKNWKDLARTNWFRKNVPDVPGKTEFQADMTEVIRLGCLQRIADSLDAIHAQMVIGNRILANVEQGIKPKKPTVPKKKSSSAEEKR